MRTRTVMIVSSAAMGGIVLVAMFMPMGKDKSLVHQISRGVSGAEDDAIEVVFSEEVTPDAPTVPASALDVGAEGGDGSDSTMSSTGRAPEMIAEAPTPEEGSPFIGSWMQESVVGDRVIRVRLRLADDGRYTGEAHLFARDGEDGAPPERTIATGGVWERRAENVVLSRMESDAPEVLPMGWREVYWDSRVEGADWAYTDADGLSRTLIRVRSFD